MKRSYSFAKNIVVEHLKLIHVLDFDASPSTQPVRITDMAALNCWTPKQLLPKNWTVLSFELVQLGNLPQQRTALSITWQHCRTTLHPQRDKTAAQASTRNAKSPKATRLPPNCCGERFPTVSGRAVNLNMTWLLCSVRRGLVVRCTPFALDLSLLPDPSPDEGVQHGSVPWALLPSWWNVMNVCALFGSLSHEAVGWVSHVVLKVHKDKPPQCGKTGKKRSRRTCAKRQVRNNTDWALASKKKKRWSQVHTWNTLISVKMTTGLKCV